MSAAFDALMSSPLDEGSWSSTDLTALSRELLRDHQDHRDVAQEAWILYQRQPAEALRSPRAWLKAAMLHLAARMGQRERDRRKRERIVARPERVPSVEEEVARSNLQELMRSLVWELPEPYREVLRLRYMEDREIEEIAALLGRSAGTVRSQLKRGLDRLRERMGARRERHWGFLAWWPRRRPRVVRWAARGVLAGVILLTAAVLGVLATGKSRYGTLAAGPAVSGGGDSAFIDLAGPDWTGRRIPALPEISLPEETAEEEQWAADVDGIVLDPQGTPVAGAAILLGDQEGGASEVVATSDAQGRYVVHGADRRKLIWAEERERAASNRHLIASKIPGVALDLHLGHPLGSLFGRVLDSGGRPVPGAEVVLLASQFGPAGFEMGSQGTLELPAPPVRSSCSPDGSFRLAQPVQDWFRILATAEGHAPVVATISSHSREGLELVLPAAFLLEGRLRREDGAAAAGVSLELVLPEPLPSHSTRTDESGLFRFPDLPPGAYVLCSEEDPTGSLASLFSEGTLAEAERVWRDLSLSADATIRGRALHGEQPVAGWIVELEQRERSGFARASRSTRTDGGGAFAFPSCSPDKDHVLWLRAPEESGPRAWALDVRGKDGDVVLNSGESSVSCSIEGRFVTDDPSTMPTAVALRSHGYSKQRLVNVDPRTGKFFADGVYPTQHRVIAWVPRLGAWMAGFAEGSPGVPTKAVIRVPEPGRVQLAVELTGGLEWDDLDAEIRTEAFYELDAKVGRRKLLERPEQSLLYAELFPGDHLLTVKLHGVLLESRTLSVRPGETTQETLQIGTVVPVTLRLLLERKIEPRERLWLTIREGERERTIELGRASRKSELETFLISLSPDTRELSVRSTRGREGSLVPASTEIVPGGTLTMPVTMPGAGTGVSR